MRKYCLRYYEELGYGSQGVGYLILSSWRGVQLSFLHDTLNGPLLQRSSHARYQENSCLLVPTGHQWRWQLCILSPADRGRLEVDSAGDRSTGRGGV